MQQYPNILAAIDIHDNQVPKVLSAAADLAAQHGSRLHVLYVAPGVPSDYIKNMIPRDFEAQVAAATESRLSQLCAALIPAGIDTIRRVEKGPVYATLLDIAEQVGADLIVIGAHQPEAQDFLIGSTASRVVRHASCSVMVVR